MLLVQFTLKATLKPPTYPQSSAPSTTLQSCHKDKDYVTVGIMQTFDPTVMAPSFYPVRCLISFSLNCFISAGRCLFHRAEERRFWPLSSCWLERPVAAAAGLGSEVKANLLSLNTLRQTVQWWDFAEVQINVGSRVRWSNSGGTWIKLRANTLYFKPKHESIQSSICGTTKLHPLHPLSTTSLLFTRKLHHVSFLVQWTSHYDEWNPHTS